MQEKTILWIAYLVIVAFAFGIVLLGQVQDAAKDVLFNEQYYARDLSLIEDVIISSPGNIKVKYSKSAGEEFETEFFEDCRVWSNIGEGKGNYFFCNDDLVIDKKMSNKQAQIINFEKTKTKLIIS